MILLQQAVAILVLASVVFCQDELSVNVSNDCHYIGHPVLKLSWTQSKFKFHLFYIVHRIGNSSSYYEGQLVAFQQTSSCGEFNETYTIDQVQTLINDDVFYSTIESN